MLDTCCHTVTCIAGSGFKRVLVLNLLIAGIVMLWAGALPLLADVVSTSGPAPQGPWRIMGGLQKSYPANPSANINWNAGYSGVADIQTAFNYARQQENSQLGTQVPLLTLPGQTQWNALSDAEKALWLLNAERVDRGLAPLHGIEQNAMGVSQYYADYLFDNDTSGHEADGNTPFERLENNPTIGACHDSLAVVENLAYFGITGSPLPDPPIDLPVERSLYNWMYRDSGSLWGHRIAMLWFPYNDNSGTAGKEGFIGFGRASGAGYQGPFTVVTDWAEVIVMNFFDPCPGWIYPPDNSGGIKSLPARNFLLLGN